jgi:hypothetical protein
MRANPAPGRSHFNHPLSTASQVERRLPVVRGARASMLFGLHYNCKPQCRANELARSSRTSSAPVHPMKERPIGQPEAVPTGIVICGNPPRPAMQVRRMTRRRKDSRSCSGVASSGEMPGAVGRQRIVPGWAKLRIRSLARVCPPRALSRSDTRAAISSVAAVGTAVETPWPDHVTIDGAR